MGSNIGDSKENRSEDQAKMTVSKEPSQPQWKDICQKVKDLVPIEIGEQAWYLIIASTLASAPTHGLLASFYTYLTTHNPDFLSERDKNRLSLRLRDVLFKITILVGMPKVLCLLMPLASAEGDVERKSSVSTLSDKWRPEKMSVQAIHDRGAKTCSTIYGPTLLPKIFDLWGVHKEDMKFHEFFTAYGLYLSDFDVMTPLESEAVVYAAISCLGLKGPGDWHLRGMGRLLGARGQDVNGEKMEKVKDQLKKLKQAVTSVVEFVGEDFVARAKPENWANVENMVRDFGGWGDDE